MSEADALSLREWVSAIKHDLAKYVAWRSANFDDAAWDGPLTDDFAEALQADVLRTRGEDPAWVVWARAVEALGDAPELQEAELIAVGESVKSLAECEASLREGGDALARARPRIRAAQQRIRAELRELHRRLASR